MNPIENFQLAPFERKCDVVTSESNYIATRQLGENKVYLYYTPGFFIEVYYSPQLKKIILINAFNKTEELAPYAEMVSLNDLNL